MKYKLRRVVSFFCAVLVLFAFLTSKPQTAKAEPITVATAVIWSVLSLLSSLGVGMAIDEDFRNDVITGVKNIPQWGAENLAKIQTAYMGAAGLAVATIGGKDYIQLKASDLSLAGSMLKNQLPTQIQYVSDKLSMAGYDHVIDCTYEYKPYSYSTAQILHGKWYVYDNIQVNPSTDVTVSGMTNAAVFVFQLESSENWQQTGSSIFCMHLIQMGSEAYTSLMNNASKKYTWYTDEQTNKSLMNMNGYWGYGMAQELSSLVSPQYVIAFDSAIKEGSTVYHQIAIPFYKNGSSTETLETFWTVNGGPHYKLSSKLGFAESTATENMELSQLKTMYGELSKLLDQLIKDNPALANDVISVPVDDDTIGNDLPGLLTMLKQLDVNSAQGVQDLITAIERALAKADVEAIATAGTLTGIAQGVTTMTGDIADVKEQVKELTDAMTEEVELDMDKMKITTSLATRFPFCIPFDLASAFSSLGGLPRTAPSWTLPWTVDGTTASIELDLAEFEEWAKVIRWGTLITFNIGLILVTRKLIKG